jgi:hypothetical protein
VRGVRDLPERRVGATVVSRSLSFLAERGIAAQPFVQEGGGLRAIDDDEIDAFVFNVSVLRTSLGPSLRVGCGCFRARSITIT